MKERWARQAWLGGALLANEWALAHRLNLCGGLLLATWFNSRVSQLSKGFLSRPHRNDPWVLGFAVLGLCVLVVVLDQCYRHWLRRQAVMAPDMLSRAALVLDIGGMDVHLLRAAAKRLGVKYPLSLLMSPANLNRAIIALSTSGLHRFGRERLRRLGKRLFGA